MRMRDAVAVMLFLPTIATGQEAISPVPGHGAGSAIARLQEVLPAPVAEQVIAVVTDATAHGLPGQMIAHRALEGAAKGRTAEEVHAAAASLARDLGVAREALRQARPDPSEGEMLAGAMAMRMGVDGAAISAVARQAPSGRSLTVPITVLGALVGRGLPSDDAIAAVLARLEARRDDRDLAELPSDAGRLIAQGVRPSEVGLSLASQRAGRPVGPPADVPRNGHPSNRARPPVQRPIP